MVTEVVEGVEGVQGGVTASAQTESISKKNKLSGEEKTSSVSSPVKEIITATTSASSSQAASPAQSNSVTSPYSEDKKTEFTLNIPDSAKVNKKSVPNHKDINSFKPLPRHSGSATSESQASGKTLSTAAGSGQSTMHSMPSMSENDLPTTTDYRLTTSTNGSGKSVVALPSASRQSPAPKAPTDKEAAAAQPTPASSPTGTNNEPNGST